MSANHRRLARVAIAAVCAASIGSAALAAGADAAAITVDRACYVNTVAGPATMTITGSGFVPGDDVSIAGGTAFASATADANGAFTTTAQAPELSTSGPGTLVTTLTATDYAVSGTITASIPVLSANLAVSTNPAHVPVKSIQKRKVTFSFSGFTPGQRVYAYYLRHKKVAAKAKFGRVSGPCGTRKQKAPIFPGSRPNLNGYKVVFENARHYSVLANPSYAAQLSFFTF